MRNAPISNSSYDGQHNRAVKRLIRSNAIVRWGRSIRASCCVSGLESFCAGYTTDEGTKEENRVRYSVDRWKKYEVAVPAGLTIGYP